MGAYGGRHKLFNQSCQSCPSSDSWGLMAGPWRIKMHQDLRLHSVFCIMVLAVSRLRDATYGFEAGSCSFGLDGTEPCVALRQQSIVTVLLTMLEGSQSTISGRVLVPRPILVFGPQKTEVGLVLFSNLLDCVGCFCAWCGPGGRTIRRQCCHL